MSKNGETLIPYIKYKRIGVFVESTILALIKYNEMYF